jgi:predicted nucleic-acid-binding Zn-ribbon protein
MAESRKRLTYVCSKCGSSNVTSDAIAAWSVAQQRWIVVGHYDSGECLNCHCDGDFVEVELAKAQA